MLLVTVAEAIADLGISRPTLYRLLHKHGLTTYSREGDRAAYVDIEALRQIRQQFAPRRRQDAAPTDSGQGPG